jgi:hypothetical protein
MPSIFAFGISRRPPGFSAEILANVFIESQARVSPSGFSKDFSDRPAAAMRAR